MPGRARRSAIMRAPPGFSRTWWRAAPPAVARQAVLQAISVGGHAACGAASQPVAFRHGMPIEAQLLHVAAHLRSKDPSRALPLLAGTWWTSAFFGRSSRRGAAAEASTSGGLSEALDRVNDRNLLNAFAPEHRALILLKFRRIAEAQPFSWPRRSSAWAGASTVCASPSPTPTLPPATGARACDGRGVWDRDRPSPRSGASRRVRANRDRRQPHRLFRAADGARARAQPASPGSMPVSLARRSRALPAPTTARPRRCSECCSNRATGWTRRLPCSARCRATACRAGARCRGQALRDANRKDEALVVARRGVSSRGADVSDFARLGDVLSSMKRFTEAADAYGRAVQARRAGPRRPAAAALLLLRASARAGQALTRGAPGARRSPCASARRAADPQLSGLRQARARRTSTRPKR